MLPVLVHRDRTVPAVIKSLVQYSKTFHLSYDVGLQMADVAGSARNIVPCDFIQGDLESSSSCHVCVTKLMRRFLYALQLIKKLNEEAASKNPSATRETLGVTRLPNPVLLSPDDHDVLLSIEAAIAHTRRRKQKATSNGRDFYSCDVYSLQELRSMHSTACKKHSLTFSAFLLKAVLQTKTFSLPVKEMFLITMIFFLRPGRQDKNCSCSHQEPRSARCSCSYKAL